jgi:hypothetical protein
MKLWSKPREAGFEPEPDREVVRFHALRRLCHARPEVRPWVCWRLSNNEEGVALTTTRKSRVIRIAAAAAVCLLGALALATVRNASGGMAKATERPSAAPVPISASALAFHDAMRKLWEDHITYTRNVIISFELDEPDASVVLPDLSTVVDRLLQNQVDIGNAIRPYYGADAGDQLTALLKEHITGAAKVLTALKANDQAALQTALEAWYANAHDIAVFLSGANPDNWPLAEIDQMMKDHLDATTAEAVARHQADWSGDVAAYDKVHAQALTMADMLSSGIIAQFPAKFRP